MTQYGDLAEAPFSELTPLVPHAAARRPDGGSWWSRLSEQLLAYLPLLLMGVLAGLSWWLVKHTPVPAEPGTAPVLRHDPDYTMHGFSVVGYGPSGAQRSRLEGEVLRHFPDTDTIEVDGVRLRSVDEQGRVTTGTATRALSNGDGTQLRLIGGARVVREPASNEPPSERLEIRGELLELSTDSERIRSTQPVTVLSSRGELRAGSLDYSHLDRAGLLGGRVTGVLRSGPPAGPASAP